MLCPPRVGKLSNEGFWKNWSLWKVAKAACAHINLGLSERLQRSRVWKKDKCDEIGMHVRTIWDSWVIISKQKRFSLNPKPRGPNIYFVMSPRSRRFSPLSIGKAAVCVRIFTCVILEWQFVSGLFLFVCCFALSPAATLIWTPTQI